MLVQSLRGSRPNFYPHASRKANVSRQTSDSEVNPVRFAALSNAITMQSVYMIGSYPPADPYRAESVAMYSGVFNFVQRLGETKPKTLGDLPLIWKPKRASYLPTFIPIQVDYSNLEQAGLVALRLRQPAPNPSIIINYTNAPGSSERSQYCLITTSDNGTYLGPVNAFMTAVCKMLDAHKATYQIHALDLDKVDRFMSEYLQAPRPAINLGWAGRDITPVVAASVAAGLDPRTFSDAQQTVTLPPATPFIDAMRTMPKLKVGESCTCLGLIDGPGDMKLSLSLSKPAFESIVSEDPIFQVTSQGHHVDQVLLKRKYQDAPFHSGVMISSSTYALTPNEYLLELGIRGESVTQHLGLDKASGCPALTLTRIQ